MSKEIDWDALNYPPRLKLVHYNLEDLEEEDEIFICHYQRILFFVIVIICIWNLISAIISSATGALPTGVVIPGTVLLLIILGAYVAILHIQVYFAIASHSKTQMLITMVMQALLFVTMVIFEFIGLANFQGWTRLTTAVTGILPGLFITLTIIESIAWLVPIVGQGYLLFKMYKVWSNTKQQKVDKKTAVKDTVSGLKGKAMGKVMGAMI